MQHRILCCIICSALVLRFVSSSGPMVHLEDHIVKSPEGALASKFSPGTSRQPPMLQLMSMSLDNWGLMHVEAEPALESSLVVQNQLRQEKSATTSDKQAPPLLSLMSVGLETWGAKAANVSAAVLPDMPADRFMSKAASQMMNPLAQVLPSESNLFDPRGFETHTMSFYLETKQTNSVRNFAIVVLLVLMLAMCSCWFCCDGCSGERESDEEDYLHSPSKEVEQDFATVELSDGSWAQVYREARGEQKEALELLFRCNIISTDEFAFSSVSQEHMQECIWIATHMLRQKPLEEWVALWQQAQQTFEDSVTACFEARGGPYSSVSHNLQPTPSLMVPALSLGAVPLAGGQSSQMEPSMEDEDGDDPYTTRSHESSSHGLRVPDTQDSQNSMDSRWSIESELDKGLAAHALK